MRKAALVALGKKRVEQLTRPDIEVPAEATIPPNQEDVATFNTTQQEQAVVVEEDEDLETGVQTSLQSDSKVGGEEDPGPPSATESAVSKSLKQEGDFSSEQSV